MSSIIRRAALTVAAIAGIAALGTGAAGAADGLPGAVDVPAELPPVAVVEPTPQEAVADALGAGNDISADAAGVPVLPAPDVPTLAKQLAGQAPAR